MARLYYQIYWDDKERVSFKPDELAALVKAVAPELEGMVVQRHQMRLMLANDVEVKIGFDVFVQVSSPNLEDTKRVFDKLRSVYIVEKQEG